MLLSQIIGGIIIGTITAIVCCVCIFSFIYLREVRENHLHTTSEFRKYIYSSFLPINVKILFLIGRTKGLRLVYIKKLYQAACASSMPLDKKRRILKQLDAYVNDVFVSQHLRVKLACTTENLSIESVDCIGGAQVKEIVNDLEIPYFFWREDQILPGVIEESQRYVSTSTGIFGEIVKFTPIILLYSMVLHVYRYPKSEMHLPTPAFIFITCVFIFMIFLYFRCIKISGVIQNVEKKFVGRAGLRNFIELKLLNGKKIEVLEYGAFSKEGVANKGDFWKGRVTILEYLGF